MVEIDNKLWENESEMYFYNESIYIIQYNNKNDILISYGVIKEINNNKLIYNGNKIPKYKFNPIFNLTNNKLIGFHKDNRKYYNSGIYLKNAIDELYGKNKNSYKYYYKNCNEIMITMNIKKENIYRKEKIYFLCKGDEDKIEIENYGHDNIKKLNKLNTELYINDKICEYKKYIFPEKEGKYRIHLKFNINLTDCSYMFSGCKNITNINFISFNTQNVINMKYLFNECNNLKQINNISKWDTENVINMMGMFYGCESLKNLEDISKWDTENVTDMSELFYYCKSLKSLPDISKWETRNLTNMKGMFSNCESLITLPDISKWDTENITDMRDIFSCCYSLNNLPDISKWNIKNVTYMGKMFNFCNSLNSLPDISKWNTKNVISMEGMFSNCESLKILPDISKWDIKNVNDMRGMFYYCESLNTFPDISKWDIKHISMVDMFYGCNKKIIPEKFKYYSK